MKIKFYLPMALFAMMAIVFAGCDKDDPTPPLPPGGDDYVLTVSDVTPSTATLHVVPVDKTQRYFFDYITLADYNKYGGTPTGIEDYLLQFIKHMTDNSGKSTADVVAEISSVGDDSHVATGLTPETDYIAFAVGINSDGKANDKAVVVSFKTMAEPAEYSLTVSDIKATTVTLTAVPVDKTKPYYFDCMLLEDYNEYGGTPDGIAEYLPWFFKAIADGYALSVAAVVEGFKSVGDDVYEVEDLDPNTDYVAFAVGVSPDGKTVGKAVITPFKTTGGGATPSLTMTLVPGDEYGANKDSFVFATIKSNNAISGKVCLLGAAIVAAAIESGITYDQIVTGNGDEFTHAEISKLNSSGLNITFRGIPPSTEVTLLVKLVNGEGATVDHIETTTEAAATAAMSVNHVAPRFDGLVTMSSMKKFMMPRAVPFSKVASFLGK